MIIPKIGGKPTTVHCGSGIRVCDREHHYEVERELQAALRTWEVSRLKNALTSCVGPDHPRYSLKSCTCDACILPEHVIEAATVRLRRLEEKIRLVESENERLKKTAANTRAVESIT